MRAIEAETFSGYGGLRQIELPKPQPARDMTPEFIARFPSAAQEHMHFENGSSP